MRARVILIAAFAFMGSRIDAQTPRTHAQSQMPASLLGIQFGKPLADSVKECPWVDASGMKAYRDNTVDYACYEEIGDFFKVDNIDLFFDVFVHQIDGRVESVDAGFHVHHADQVLQALRAKFGAPLIDEVTHLRNAMGASFRGRSLIWRSSHLQVDFESPATDVDHGSISAYTPIYIASLKRQREQEKNAIKGVL